MSAFDDADAFDPAPMSLRDRAKFARIDELEAERMYLSRMAAEKITAIFGPNTWEGRTEQEIDSRSRCVGCTIDGLSLRVTEMVVTRSSSNSNSSIDGIHEETLWKVEIYYRSSWMEIKSLADLGKYVELLEQHEALQAKQNASVAGGVLLVPTDQALESRARP